MHEAYSHPTTPARFERTARYELLAADRRRAVERHARLAAADRALDEAVQALAGSA